jgi:rhodanese-related sulfurtransferase
MKRALREAGFILLVAPLIALVYNVFAATRIPWIRQIPKGDTVSYEQLIEGNGSASAMIDTAATSPVTDTTSGATTTVVDTAVPSTAVAAQEKERIQDSLRRLADAARLRDSLKRNKPSEAPPTDTQKEPSVAENGGKPKEIGTAVAKRIFDEKRALFIDARPAEQFAEGHIPGAISVYAEEFNKSIPTLLGYPMDTLVVAYCGGGLCELSHELADRLVTLGFKKVVVYTGGTTEWNENNYPFTKK